jgi:hypothetical protein
MTIEEFFRLIAGCLIIFGLSFSATLTLGPFGLFKLVRDKLGSRFKSEHAQVGLNCPICASAYFGIIVAYLMSGGVVMWLAGVGFTCVVTSLSPDDSDED